MSRATEAVLLKRSQLSQHEHRLVVYGAKLWLGTAPPTADGSMFGASLSLAQICARLGGEETSQCPDNVRKALLSRSFTRKNPYRTPPLCLLCLNCDPHSTNRLGSLRWLPEFPIFFGLHMACAKSVDGCQYTLDEQHTVMSELEASFFAVNLTKLASLFRKTIRSGVTCSSCGMAGATICCHFCRLSKPAADVPWFHLPCAIRDELHVTYQENGTIIVCGSKEHGDKEYTDVCNYVLGELVQLAPEKLAVQFNESLGRVHQGSCDLCTYMVRFDPDYVRIRDPLRAVLVTSCCGFKVYHHQCMQKYVSDHPFSAPRCPICKKSNKETKFHVQLSLQGVFAREIGEAESNDGAPLFMKESPFATACYNRECEHPRGPWLYDMSQIRTGNTFLNWEPVNECLKCHVWCHRKCAGEPWSGLVDSQDQSGSSSGSEDEPEPIWFCDECREDTQFVAHTEEILKKQKQAEKASSSCVDLAVGGITTVTAATVEKGDISPEGVLLQQQPSSEAAIPSVVGDSHFMKENVVSVKGEDLKASQYDDNDTNTDTTNTADSTPAMTPAQSSDINTARSRSSSGVFGGGDSPSIAPTAPLPSKRGRKRKEPLDASCFKSAADTLRQTSTASASRKGKSRTPRDDKNGSTASACTPNRALIEDLEKQIALMSDTVERLKRQLPE